MIELWQQPVFILTVSMAAAVPECLKKEYFRE